MKPAGIIITYIDWRKWKTWWFNVPLVLFQLTFLIVGKAYGKIPDLHGRNTDFWGLGKIIALAFLGFFLYLTAGLIYTHEWLYAIPSFVMIYHSLWLFGGAKWSDIWRAAQASHVRLVLERAEDEQAIVDIEWGDGHTSTAVSIEKVWFTANFGYPKMEIQPWYESWNKDNFEYREPTFPTPLEFMEPVIQYANDQVGKGYDDLQLISNGLHLIPWIVYPPCWGKELKIIKALNRKGGREQCISGIIACLRWGEPFSFSSTSLSFADIRKAQELLYRATKAKVNKKYIAKIKQYTGKFFPGYSTAVMSPCLAVISKNWKKVKQ